MTPLSIVFLDRATIADDIVFPEPGFPYTWQDYAQTSSEQRAVRLRDTDCVITNKVVIDDSLLSQCPNLKYVGVSATGFNVVDLEACKRRGIAVTNVKGYSTDGVAEHAFLLMLSLKKQLKAYQQSLPKGAWQAAGQFVYYHGAIENLKGRVLALIGTGEIAQATAALAKAFGMSVLFFSPSGRKDVAGVKCCTFDEVLQQADIVSLHCPLNTETEGLFNAAAFEKMKPSAVLINTARGPVVDISALIHALKKGEIAGAGLDVLPEEPPELNSEIMSALTMPQLVVTPHTAWASQESQQELIAGVVHNLNCFALGKPFTNLAD